MIDYNRKLSNERETQFHPIECLPLYCLKLLSLLKNVTVSVMLSNTTTGPDSKLKLTDIDVLNPLYTYRFFLLV